MAAGKGLAGDLADVGKVLDELTEVVTQARSMPMSASCVVNRAEVLGLVEELRARLPVALGKAQDVLGDRAGVVDDGRREAERVLERAQAERRRLLAQTDVLADAQGEADRVLQEAHEQAEAVRAEVEDYVDAKLANFEIVLTKTLEAVERGRHKLSGAHELDVLREDDDDLPPLPG
jgi:cell division septum initiation protein DivIVA